MPEHKSESEKIQYVRPYLVAVGILGVNILGATIFTDQFPMPENIQLAAQVIAGVFHVAGRIADIISTSRLIEKANEVERRLHIDTTISETAPYLPPRPTLKDMLKPSIIALEVGRVIPSVILPPVGILTGARSFRAAHYNNRLRNSLIVSTSA